MGLDLYHFRANSERRGGPFSLEPQVEGFGRMLQKFAGCTVTLHDVGIDWARTLAAHGFLAEHFQSAGSALTAGRPGTQMLGYFAFARCADAPADLPGLIVLNNLGRDDDLMLSVVRGRHPDVEATMLRGPLKVHRVAKTALFCEEIGYQRKAVLGAFYDEFKSTEYVTEIERVRRIYDLTERDRKPCFKAEFLDNWSEQSFVEVSW